MRPTLDVKSIATMTLLGAAICSAWSCNGSPSSVLGGVPAIAYLQRSITDTGNVFDYANASATGNLFTLTPPTATGVKTNLTNWTGGDVMAFDLSFDGREIVFSGRAPGETVYHLYRINADGTNPCDADAGKSSTGPCQITMGPNDDVYPIYIPGGRIFFVTNQNVEGVAVPQFRDEYERATTAQVATCKVDGSDPILGPRNVSHRVAPTLLADGRIMLTEWRHLGETNEGDLIIMNQDMTRTREGFGREGKGVTDSYLHAREVAPGMIAVIGTSRDDTYQAGKLLLVNLGGAVVGEQSEAKSSAVDLTPLVPGDRTPSFTHVGRYYDVNPLDTTGAKFLVSWADGAVQSETLSQAMQSPDFGIYVFDAASKSLTPVVNDIGTWEVSPRPIVPRNEPPALASAFVAAGTQSTLLAAINVYDSTMFPNLVPGSVVMARFSEGFSSEEGFPNDFGLTEFDGMSRLGEVAVPASGAFKALVPANTPIRITLLDKYGMSVSTTGPGGVVTTEPLWIQGRPGEALVCGGCHEDRTKTIEIAPGSSVLQALDAAPFDMPASRTDRVSTTYTQAAVRGVPWDKALQPIFDAHCIDCHDGTAGAANPSYTLMDMTKGTTFSFTFNLTSTPVTIDVGEKMYTFSASHVSLIGPMTTSDEDGIMVTMGTVPKDVMPGDAHDSKVIQMLNPPARYPSVNMADRAFGTKASHPAEVGTYNGHDGTAAQYQLTADEYYLMQLMADNGGQFYSRENAPGGN